VGVECFVQFFPQRFEFLLVLVPDDVDLGIVGDRFECDVRDTLVDKAVANVERTIKQAEESLQNAKQMLPETESTLAQLDTTAKTLGQTIETLDKFMRQFESEDDDPSKPFDINEYTLAAAELGKTTHELNVLVSNLDQAVQQDRIDQTFGAAKSQVSALIWQGGFVLLGVGLILILAAKLIPRRG